MKIERISKKTAKNKNVYYGVQINGSWYYTKEVLKVGDTIEAEINDKWLNKIKLVVPQKPVTAPEPSKSTPPPEAIDSKIKETKETNFTNAILQDILKVLDEIKEAVSTNVTGQALDTSVSDEKKLKDVSTAPDVEIPF